MRNNMYPVLSVILLIVSSLLLFGKGNGKVDKCVSVVIPAFNEEKTIEHVINTVKQVSNITEIIVVDDGSTDSTYDIVSKFEDILLFKHSSNKGKGSAMKTGLRHVKNDIVLFLDADLSEINEAQVEAIIGPILDGSADITKTKFKREAGRVTELTAKPLLQFFFPELNFDQPLSGQFAAVKSFLDKIDLEHDYGVDIGIVLDADAQGMRIQEVDIGNIVHEMSTLQELNLMANEVVRTIVDRAVNYGRLTMVDDLGNAIRLEIMALSIITFGIFGLFFIKALNTTLSGIIILFGVLLSIYYLYKIVRMSLKVYRQSKVSSIQIIRSFIRMHFPVVISVVILLAIVFSLLGSVHITSNEISIEPASRNLVISTSPEPRSSVDVRGPYTVENALENEEQLIRLSNSALNTLQAQYGDNLYIDGKYYQLEQSVNNENDLIRIPESARKILDVTPGTVVRDSDLRALFEDAYVVRDIHNEEGYDYSRNNTTESIFNATTVNIGSKIVGESMPSKFLKIFVNETEVAHVSGVFNNSSYIVNINNASVGKVKLDSSANGTIFNDTYKGSRVDVVVEDLNMNSSNVFADENSRVKFLNIYLS